MFAAMSPSRWAFLGRQRWNHLLHGTMVWNADRLGNFFGGRRSCMCLLVISWKEGIIGCPNLTLLIDTASIRRLLNFCCKGFFSGL